MILALLLLWIASGFGLAVRTGAIQSAHYAMLRGWLRCLSGAAAALLGLEIEVVDPPEPRPGPLLVFGRHAGAGNSLMMIRMLMLRYRRRPRVVILAFLQSVILQELTLWVNALGRAVVAGAAGLRRLQTGYTVNYALTMLAGAVAIAVYLLTRS